MNEWRQTYAYLTNKGMTRKEIETNIEVVNSKFAETRPLAVKIEAMSQTNWPLIGILITIIAKIVVAIWVIVLKIEAINSPTKVSIESLNIRITNLESKLMTLENTIKQSTQADALSTADRAKLNSRLELLEKSVQLNSIDERANIATSTAELAEIETQFQSISNVINLQQDNNQQLLSVIYSKVFIGQSLPLSNFRPKMYR